MIHSRTIDAREILNSNLLSIFPFEFKLKNPDGGLTFPGFGENGLAVLTSLSGSGFVNSTNTEFIGNSVIQIFNFSFTIRRAEFSSFNPAIGT